MSLNEICFITYSFMRYNSLLWAIVSTKSELGNAQTQWYNKSFYITVPWYVLHWSSSWCFVWWTMGYL